MRLSLLPILLLAPLADLVLLAVLALFWPWYWTAGMVLGSALVGLSVLRRGGAGGLRVRMGYGQAPFDSFFDVAACVLLIWPGPLGDLLGLALLLPPTGRRLQQLAFSWLAGRLLGGSKARPRSASEAPPGQAPASKVIDVRVVEPRTKPS